MTCPVCVFHASNVNRETLRGFACHNCGRDLSEHELTLSPQIAPSKAYAVNRDLVERWSLGEAS